MGRGSCTSNAPTLVANTYRKFPRMHEKEWCREYRPLDASESYADVCLCGHKRYEHYSDVNCTICDCGQFRG